MLTSLPGMNLPKLSSPKMPKAYKKKPLSIRKMMSQKLTGFLKIGKLKGFLK